MPTTRLNAAAPPLLLIALATALLLALVFVTTSGADAAAAAADELIPHELMLPAGSDNVNDGGVNGSGAAEWLTFAIPLGAFIILVVPLMWVVFGIDRSEGRE